MDYSIEKHLDGYCIVTPGLDTVAVGAPHHRSTLYLATKKEAEKLLAQYSIDTMKLKEDWTPEHHALFETIPAIVRNIAGDLFEMKWYSHCNYDGMMWEIENNVFDNPEHVAKFKEAYDSLTDHVKCLIYYAYEA